MIRTATLSRPQRRFAEGFFATVLATFFLFFIDEGYYDLRWMRSPGNWIAFLLYILGTFPLYWLLARLMLREGNSVLKVLLIAALGAFILISAFLLFK